MVALCPVENGYVAGHYIEILWLRPEQLKNMLENSYLYEKFQNFLNFFLQIAIFKHIFESRRA